MVQLELAVRAGLHADVLVQVLDFNAYASAASLETTVEKVISTSCFADAALVAVELLFRRVKVNKAAYFAKVFAELDFALHAVEVRILDAGTLVALDLSDVLLVELMRANGHLRRFLISVVVRDSKRRSYDYSLVPLVVMTNSARIELLTYFTFERTFALVVVTDIPGGCTGDTIDILLPPVKLFASSELVRAVV